MLRLIAIFSSQSLSFYRWEYLFRVEIGGVKKDWGATITLSFFFYFLKRFTKITTSPPVCVRSHPSASTGAQSSEVHIFGQHQYAVQTKYTFVCLLLYSLWLQGKYKVKSHEPFVLILYLLHPTIQKKETNIKQSWFSKAAAYNLSKLLMIDCSHFSHFRKWTADQV